MTPTLARAAGYLLPLVVAAGGAAASLAGQASSQAQAELRRAAERLRALEREAEALAAQERTLLVELRQLEVDRDLRAAQLARLRAEQAATAEELARVEQEVTRLDALVVRQRPEVAARLVELYKLGRAGYWRLLLDVEDLRAIGRAYRSVAALARLDRERLAAHRRTLAELMASRAELQARQAEIRRLEAETARARAALDRAVAMYEQRIGEIDRRRDLAAELTGELQLAYERLQTTLGALAAAGGPVPALPLAPFRGDLDWPVHGRLAAPSGAPRSRAEPAGRRNGVDILAPDGSPVRAVHAGTVAYAAPFTGYGNLVILDHGHQAYTLYGYLASLAVERGARVARGDLVGTVGRPPTGEAARVYFEIRVDGRPVDPVEWLRKR